ncbi:MAG: DNA/RNA non-specific endonuclease [Alphaproteobacteria bacterium]
MIESSDRFKDLVEKTKDARANVRRLVNTKRWQLAEPDRNRFASYVARVAAKVPAAARGGAESLQGNTIDFQGAWFLPDGAQARRAVAYVEVTAGGKSSVGSGFMISPHLFLTNQHVIGDGNAARGAQITFDREAGDFGRPMPTTSFLLDPDRFALFSREEELDYAIVAVGERNSGAAAIADFGYCALSDKPDKHVIGMSVNIIQHPNGLPKMIAIRNNMLQFRTDHTLLYQTDTEPGSSGAPVFNDDWEVIALHHYGEPFLEHTDDQGQPIPTNVNEGVRISAIYRDLDQKAASLKPEQQDLLREALAFDKQAPQSSGGKKLSPPHPHDTGGESASIITRETPMAQASSSQELRVSIPIEVTVRVGAPGAAAAVGAVVAGAAPAKVLQRSAEKLQVDDDYSNRHGYNAGFVAGVQIPLPEPGTKLAKQVAPLRAGEPNMASGELKYEHFSVKLNKSKKMAMFTATNIDGETYLDVDRKTGKVKAEGETWFSDPRVSDSFFLNQSFYSDWSTYFDRGHLTRRTDPTWGSDDEAERANADTFHFTNCTPQHFRFNQSAKFWQGAERYVLENGVLSAGAGKHITVFQGPIFNDAIDRSADDIQIPSSFFKVIVWRSQNGKLKSVGIVVDQLNLLDEERKAIGAPQDLAAVDVTHWLVRIKDIETRTDLSLGDDVRAADTFGQGQQHVGEAQVPIKSLTDIPLT